MIHYDLRCGGGHSFDGWFRDSAAFDTQARRGQLDCPVCGSVTVERALMAPRLSRGAKRPRVIDERRTQQPAAGRGDAPQAEGVSPQVSGAAHGLDVAPPAMPDQVRAMLQRLRAEVERRADYVGSDFADEARRIHKGEAKGRPIYGETSPEQAEALADDGIEVVGIPWVPRADS